jgi:hypothetical protein
MAIVSLSLIDSATVSHVLPAGTSLADAAAAHPAPLLTLLPPPRMPHHPPQPPLAHRLHAVDGLQLQHPFPDVRRQQGEVEELRDPSPRKLKPPGNIGAVANLSTLDGGLKALRWSS